MSFSPPVYKWIRVSAKFALLHLVSWPIIILIGFGSAMGSFTHDKPKPTPARYWEPDTPPFFVVVWTAGFRISSFICDRVLFGGPLPPEPCNPDFADPNASAKLEAMSRIYWPEYHRRKWIYKLCWFFNEIFFGGVCGSIFMFAKYRSLSTTTT